MRQLFIIKCDRNLLENATGFLLQNATFITNCDSTTCFVKKQSVLGIYYFFSFQAIYNQTFVYDHVAAF